MELLWGEDAMNQPAVIFSWYRTEWDFINAAQGVPAHLMAGGKSHFSLCTHKQLNCKTRLDGNLLLSCSHQIPGHADVAACTAVLPVSSDFMWSVKPSAYRGFSTWEMWLSSWQQPSKLQGTRSDSQTPNANLMGKKGVREPPRSQYLNGHIFVLVFLNIKVILEFMFATIQAK